MTAKKFTNELAQKIEGIGPKYGERLAKVGIKTLEDLRRMSIDDIHRKTEISKIRLAKWQAMAVLQWVSGIDHQISEVLVRGGITDLQKLIDQEPNRILQMIKDAREPKEAYNIIPDDYDRVITLADVREWQREARGIISPPVPPPEEVTPEFTVPSAGISAQSYVSIEIQRESETSEATMGTLTIGDLTLYTLEPPAKKEDGGGGGGW